MALPKVFRILLTLTFLQGLFEAKEISPSYEQNYEVIWGNDHISSGQQGRELQLSLDKNSGSGIRSRLTYYSGFFHMKLKLPGNDTAGVITTFYLKSPTSDNAEMDFEFLGNRQGKPYILQTNVFAQDRGDREQRIHLWFDPTENFHSYRLLWNQHHIVFLIDNKPIRIFKNNTSVGVNYPTEAMHVIATIWNGDGWATGGGKEKINWTSSPFRYYLKSFSIKGCPNNSVESCYSTKYQWNTYQSLNTKQQRVYDHVKRKYMIYDYCTDISRFPTLPPECPQLQPRSPLGAPRVPVVQLH